MIQAHHLLSAALAVAALGLVRGQSPAQPPNTPAPPPALQWAEGRVFQITVSPKPGTGGNDQVGTAVLLADRNGLGVFATCYHVLRGGDSFNVYDRDGIDGTVATSATRGTRLYRAWNRDLVLFETRLMNKADRRRPVFSTENLKKNRGEALLVAPPGAHELRYVRLWAAGFPLATDRKPIAAEVYLQTARRFVDLNIYRSDYKWIAPKDGDDTDVAASSAGVLSRELTFPGMSGCPLVDDDGRVGGLLFGRGSGPLGPVGLVIPAQDVRDALESADANSGNLWWPFNPSRLTAPPVFKDGVDQNSADPGKWVDELDWTAFDRWITVFQDRPSQALARFHEVSVGAAELRRLAALKLKKDVTNSPVSIRAVVPDANELPGDTSLVFNGRPAALPIGKEVELHLVPGENLLILQRRARNGDVVVNDLFRPNRLAIEVCVDGVTVLTIRRSLPAAVHGFPVYVTLIDDRAQPGDARPANGRVAVRLDELAGLLGLAPLRHVVDVKDDRGSFAKGSVSLRPASPLTFAMLSDQTLGVQFGAEVQIADARANLPFLRVSAQNKLVGGMLSARIQFPRRLDDLNFFSARVHGMDSSDTILVRLPVTIEAEVRPKGGGSPQVAQPEGLDVDLSGVLRLALTGFLNNQLLRSAEAENPPLIQARGLFARAVPVPSLPGREAVPRELLLRRAPDGSEWLVLTFRVADPDGSIPLVLDDLLPPPDQRGTTALEVLVRGAPAAFVRPLLANANRIANPLFDRLLATDGRGPVAGEIRLQIRRGEFAAPPNLETVILPDVKNKLPGALRAVVDETIAHRSVECEATLAPVIAAGAIRHLLTEEKALDELTLDGKGVLKLEIRRNPVGWTVTLTGDGRPFTVTKKGTLKLADGATIENPSLTFNALRLEGDMVKGTVKGTAEGSMHFSKAVIDGRSVRELDQGDGKKTPAGGSFKADIDTARERPLKVEMKKPTGLATFKNGKSAEIPSEAFDIWIERPTGSGPRVGTNLFSKLLLD